MGTIRCFLATIIAILVITCDNEALADEETTVITLPIFETCPCLPTIVCPHVYGSNPEDEKYFGTVLKCDKPEDVRCCGASTSVVTSKAILPVNLPEEYQMRVDPSSSVTVEPMEIVTAEQPEIKTATDADIPTTFTDMTITTSKAPIATTGSYKHEHLIAEGRAAKFSAEEIENMKKRLRVVLKRRGNSDLVFEESRFRKTYQSTEASTTSKTTRRSSFSKKDKTTTTTASLETFPPKVLMHKFDTRNRQNFLKTSRTTTTASTTPMTTTTTTESIDFKDDEEEEEDEDENQVDNDIAESTNVQKVVDTPKRPTNTYSTRGRMRYGMRQSMLDKQTIASSTRPTMPKELTHDINMVILEDVNNQISEKRAAKEFKESMLLDFYFEKDDDHGPAPQATTEGSKRAEPVYESGFVPMIFN